MYVRLKLLDGIVVAISIRQTAITTAATRATPSKEHPDYYHLLSSRNPARNTYMKGKGLFIDGQVLGIQQQGPYIQRLLFEIHKQKRGE